MDPRQKQAIQLLQEEQQRKILEWHRQKDLELKELLQRQQKDLQALIVGFEYEQPAAIDAAGDKGSSCAYGEEPDEDDPYGELSSAQAEPVEMGKPLEQHACFRGGFGRADVQKVLQGKPKGTYLLRSCGDPSERINGQPNPNLCVMSFSKSNSGDMAHVKVWRYPDVGFGTSSKAEDCLSHSTIEALAVVVIGENAHPLTV